MISPDDRGFLFADAIYEVVRFYRGRAFHLAEHLDRMARGARTRCASRPTPTSIPTWRARLLEENGLVGRRRDRLRPGVPRRRSARARLSARRHAADRLRLRARARSAAVPRRAGAPSSLPDDALGSLRHQDASCFCPMSLAAQRAREAGAIDAILVRDGVALEGTKANLFLVVGRRVCGPRRTGRGFSPALRASPRSPPRAPRDPVEERALHARGDASPRTRSSSPRRRCGPIPSWRSPGSRSPSGEPGPIAAAPRRKRCYAELHPRA